MKNNTIHKIDKSAWGKIMGKWNFYTSKEIRPEGWLRRQLRIQADGLSGNLYKIWPDVRDSAWIGGNREGWERVPYWLDGFIPLAYLLEDDELISTAKKYIDAIVSAQEDDGWICPCPKDKRAKYDTWAIQLICKTLKVYYDCSGDEKIPDVIYRVLRNYYELLSNGEIKLFGWAKYRWFESFGSLNFLYEKYQEDWIKDLAKIIKEQGYDYNQAIDSWKKPSHLWLRKTHIVNIAMMLKSEAVSHELLGEVYSDNAEKLRKFLDKYNGTAFEGFTGDEVLSGLDPTRGTECCAVVEQMYSYEEIFAHTGDNKWAERLEVLAFNALPATLSEDMWTHQYVQQVNQIACRKTMIMAPFSTNGPYAHTFGLEPNFGCCTANFNQGWPKFALSSFMHKGDTIINSVMLPSVLKEKDVTIKLETDYPFNNKMHYYIDSQKDFNFKIRIPSFAKNLKVNGADSEVQDLEFAINAGKTELEVEFEAEPYFKKRPNDLYALQMGSLLFSVPIDYEKKIREYTKKGVERKFPYCDYQFIPTTPWNYGYSSSKFEVKYHKSGSIPFSRENPPVTIKADMQQINWGLKFPYKSVCRKTPKSREPITEVRAVELCPYGCARLRMTEMPVLDLSAKFSLPENFTITAHTGCEKTPANSLESIKKGVECGADIVEFDVRFDENKMPVISHDAPKGGEVTFEQALQELSKYKKLKANIDIKSTENLKEIQNLVKKYDLLDRVFYTGIFESFVDAAKKDSPEILYYLNITDVLLPKFHTDDYLMSLVQKVKCYGAIGINFNYKNASKELVDTFRKNGLLVSIWTVNKENDFYRILSYAPDNITTKLPGFAKNLLNQK